MEQIVIHAGRFILRDFTQEDREAFLAYQMDTRYRALYDLDESYIGQARDLFDLFIAWQSPVPRTNIQLGIFNTRNGDLLGSAGLRNVGNGGAEFGIEIAPEEWGRFALAFDVTSACLGYGFLTLGLDIIHGSTASGNSRIAKLARWFSASVVSERPGPDWMAAKGWREVDWAVARNDWMRVRHRRVAHDANAEVAVAAPT
jgi:[ribosomal protein S5]-alanine N-acetyltransferase